MVDSIKNNLYMKNFESLYKQGIMDGRIVPFDEAFYERLSHTYISSLPVSIHIKYLKPTGNMPRKCIDRSLYMFLSIDESTLVRADQIRYGKDRTFHGWIEIGDYVYDPSFLERFDKDLYYEIFKPTNIAKCNKQEYCAKKENKQLYEEVRNTSIDDYKPFGKNRLELAMSIPLVSGIAEFSGNEDFINDLNRFLKEIEYDEEEINNEIDTAMKEHIKQKFKKVNEKGLTD